MPSTKEIRMKIKSVNNTRKITNAMQMVAASKMRKAQDRMFAGLVRMAQEFVRLFRTLQPPIRTTIIRSSLRTMTPKKSVLS